jgi:hypothetical protein
VSVKSAINLDEMKKAKQNVISATELDSRNAANQATLGDSTVGITLDTFVILLPKRSKSRAVDRMRNSTTQATNRYELTVSDFATTIPITLTRIRSE